MTTQPATVTIDPAEAEAFAGRMLQVVNDAVLGLVISLGQQTGLIDRLAELPPSTSEQIATAAGFNERYVREWLGAMVTGRIVDYDPTTRTYSLPPAHAAFLTTAAGPDNIGYFTRYIAVLAGVESRIVECFRTSGGVGYDGFAGFQEVQGGETRSVYDATLLQRTVPSIPGLTEKLTAGIDVADIGCGQGHAINVLAGAFPKSRFTGYDFSDDGLAAARAEASALGLTNARFVAQDVAKLDVSGAYDLITAFDAIHDQVAPRSVLANIRRALRPGGTFLMVDIAASSNLEENIDHPLGPAFYGVSLMHCMTVSLAHGGEGLGTMWGDQKARELLAEAGFNSVGLVTIEGDEFNNYYVCRTN
ncbi:MAG: class I SAM-dependent methyltransferase [Hyphomicrobiales bacterium]